MEGQDDEDHGDFEDDYGDDDDLSHNSEAQRELDIMDMEERLKGDREDAAKRIQALVAKKSSASKKPAPTKRLPIKGAEKTKKEVRVIRLGVHMGVKINQSDLDDLITFGKSLHASQSLRESYSGRPIEPFQGVIWLSEDDSEGPFDQVHVLFVSNLRESILLY